LFVFDLHVLLKSIQVKSEDESNESCEKQKMRNLTIDQRIAFDTIWQRYADGFILNVIRMPEASHVYSEMV